MTPSRIPLVLGLIGLAAVARLLPHPPNFAPVTAMALFAGCYLADRRLALFVPLAAMFLTDLLLGLHATLPFVYAGVALTVLIGARLAARRTAIRVAGAALLSSTLFFAVSNLGVWLLAGLYPRDAAGLLTCYLAAIPFFQRSLLADLCYTALLFAAMALAERRLLAGRRGSLPAS